MTTIGYATLQIIPSLKGVSGEINKQLAAMPEVGTAAGKKIGKELEQGVAQGAEGAAGQVKTRLSERLGSQVGSVVGKGIGAGIKLGIAAGASAAALAVGGIGIALTKGFDRLKSIDEATFKLKALGHSADETKQIMDNALASVKGTAFGLQDAATAAASAVAAGIKPGQDLTKYLKEVGDAAAVAGTNFTDMGSIFGKIQTSNKAYTDDLNQLADRGLPIFQWLQSEYGVTGDKLTEMVQKGEVDSAHFQEAIEKNIGGAAQKMGESFEGSVQNAEAALARLGAAILSPVFGNAAGGIGGITSALDKITGWVNSHQKEVISFFTDIGLAAINTAQMTVQAFAKIAGAGADIASAFGQDELANKLRGASDALTHVADGFDAAKEKVRNFGITAAEKVDALALTKIPGLIGALNSIPNNKGIRIDANGNAVTVIPGLKLALDGLHDKDINLNVHGNAAVSGTSSAIGATMPGPIARQIVGDEVPVLIGPGSNANTEVGPLDNKPHHATGGSIFGPGSGTSDSIPAMLSNGEHVWTADEVTKLGGQGAMYRLRGMVKAGLLKGFAPGGAVSGAGDGGGYSWPPMLPQDQRDFMAGFLSSTPGGNFNPAMKIDTSTSSVAPSPYEMTFGMLKKTIQRGDWDGPNQPPSHPNRPMDNPWWIPGFNSGGSVDMLDILSGRSGQPDNWARYDTFDPMQHAMMQRNLIGVDPSGLRTPGGGIFNPGMRIDTSTAAMSPKGFDNWRLTYADLQDATTWEPGERDNPTFYARQAIINNDPLWSWIKEKGGGFAGGGAVGGSGINVDAFKKFASGINGGRYIRGGPPGLSGTDCSGAQSALANFLTGGSGRFATGSEGQGLTSRGFQLGDPPPGITAYWVGWKNGGPGGGHTAGTILDPTGGNVNVEMGGSSGGGAYGGRAGGASGFANRAWIALAGAIADGVKGGEDPRTPDDFTAGPSSAGPVSSGGGGFSLPSSLSGLSGFGLSGLGKGIGTTGSGSDLSLFGNAAASAVTGQASSLLGAFGISDNPPILQAASQLLGGISIGGHGGSAAPLSANSSTTGTQPPDGVHGGRAGQAPGPVFNTTISAFDTTDAVARWDSQKNQMVAAKLSAF